MNDRIIIENTRFIFATNFAGDPLKDNFGSTQRYANIIIPNEEIANQLRAAGVKVKPTKPRDNENPDEFVPTWFFKGVLKYRNKRGELLKRQPVVRLVSGDAEPEDLFEDNVGMLDDIYVLNVKVTIEPYCYDPNKGDDAISAAISVLYVEQDTTMDPFAGYYANRF